MSDVPPIGDRQPPVALPRERLALPGSRVVWWLLAGLTLAVPLAAHLISEPAPQAEDADSLTAELRGRTFLWRLMSNTQPQAVGGKKAPDDVDDKRRKELEDADWQELVSHARELDGAESTAAREALIVHALAVEQPQRAVALAREVTLPSADVQALLTGLPDAPTPAVLDRSAALARLKSKGFGQPFSSYQRDHARQLAFERLEDLDHARKWNAALRERDSRLVPAWSTAAMLFLIALFVGGGFWFGVLLRGLAAPAGAHAGRAWVRSRYPGLPRDLPYLTDPLLPWLGFGGWLSGYLLANVALASLPGQRAMSGLGVLFQAGVGAMTAIAVVQTFARQPPGLAYAARWLDPPQPGQDAPPISVASALLAALRVLSALLPVMAAVVLVQTALGQSSPEHPVSGLVLNDTDPLQLGAIGVSVTLLAPLGEELIFRGFLYRALRMRWGVWPALLVTSLAFSALHPSLGPYLVLSGAFCLAYEWTGSLWAPMLLHGIWNGLTFGVLVGVAVS